MSAAPVTVVTGAAVFDGARMLPAGTDVIIAGDRIAGVETGAPPPDARIVEAAGLILTPAFIDTHNHGDYHCVEHGNDGLSLLAQGVGTMVVGNCGYSAMPEGAPHPVLLPGPDARNLPLDARRARLEAGGMAIGVADLLGHGTLRRHVLGGARKADRNEIARMCDMLDAFLAGGGSGLSVGLNYPEAAGYDADELVPLCKVLARHGRPITAHIADQGGGILGSVGEVIDWADAGGCPALISHMRPISDRFDHLLEPLFALFESRENARFDLYPYAAGFTALNWMFSYLFARQPAAGAMLPDEQVEEGARGICIGGLDDVRILASRVDAAEGRTIAEMARDRGVRPGRLAQDILIADPETLCLFERESRPETIDRIITHPLCLIGSDGYLFGHTHSGACHPRCYGAFAGFIERYGRTGAMTREDTLARLTARPADFFGFSDRGRIAPGLRADLTLLDWDAVAETPGPGPARGTAWTMIGGQIVYSAPETTGIRPGTRAVPGAPAGRA